MSDLVLRLDNPKPCHRFGCENAKLIGEASERITELERALAILTSEEVENMALGAAERITELETLSTHHKRTIAAGDQLIHILQAEVAALKDSVRWIPVSEPPECGEKVLIPAMFGEVEIARYLNGKWYDNNGCLRVNLSGNPLPPKVWRHMPLPPVEQG